MGKRAAFKFITRNEDNGMFLRILSKDMTGNWEWEEINSGEAWSDWLEQLKIDLDPSPAAFGKLEQIADAIHTGSLDLMKIVVDQCEFCFLPDIAEMDNGTFNDHAPTSARQIMRLIDVY